MEEAEGEGVISPRENHLGDESAAGVSSSSPWLEGWVAGVEIDGGGIEREGAAFFALLRGERKKFFFYLVVVNTHVFCV